MAHSTDFEPEIFTRRIDRLEVRLRWTLVALAVTITGTLILAARVARPRPLRSMSVRRLSLVDSLGREVAWLAVDGQGPSLRFAGLGGATEARLGMTADGPALSLRDSTLSTNLHFQFGSTLIELNGPGSHMDLAISYFPGIDTRVPSGAFAGLRLETRDEVLKLSAATTDYKTYPIFYAPTRGQGEAWPDR